MILKLEIEAEDAMQLICLHHAFMEKAIECIGDDPLFYSRAANITNNFLHEVTKKIPLSEIKRLQKKQ